MSSSHENGPLTGPAQPDGILSGFEFLMRFKKEDIFRGYKQHTMWPYADGGCYSDDTQMELGAVEWYLEDGVDPRNMLHYLTRAFLRDKRGGSPRMRAYFNAVEAGKNPVLKLTSGSGAAMRSSFFGLLDLEQSEMLALVAAQAATTHNGEGVLAAQAAALMSRFMLRGADKNDLARLVVETLNEPFLMPVEPLNSPGNSGVECVRAALYLIGKTETFCELIQGAADLGGDTDTVGKIAMGAVWMSRQFKNDLPALFFEKMENGPYGRDYLREKEIALLEKINRTSAYPVRLRCD